MVRTRSGDSRRTDRRPRRERKAAMVSNLLVVLSSESRATRRNAGSLYT